MKLVILCVAVADDEVANGLAERLYEDCMNAHDDSPDTVTLYCRVEEPEDEDRKLLAERIGDDEEPDQCECDNTHTANGTVCRHCYNRGHRGKA